MLYIHDEDNINNVINYEHSKKYKHTVVIIDDEYTNRTILGETIQNVSPLIRVELFANPIEALEWMESHPVDLIYTDYNMKQMSGLMVLKKIRSTPKLKKTPVIIISSILEKKLRYQLLEDGALDFVNKPIDLYEIAIRCKNILQLVSSHEVEPNREEIS